MHRYHAHVYFEPMHLSSARRLAEQADRFGRFEYVKLCEHPIGPHPVGMIEIHFEEAKRETAVSWLDAHRGIFSVLVHRDTGDDVHDHTHGVLWLGPEVPIDFSFFDRIQANPELRIHPIEFIPANAR